MLNLPDALVLRPLARNQIGQAFALVRQELPDATERRWAAFAASRTGAASAGSGRGIMTLQSQAGYILGLFVYDVRDELHEGRTLHVTSVAVAQLIGRRTLARQLADGMAATARLHGCMMVDVELPESDPHGDLATLFREQGFDPAGRHARRQAAAGEA